MKTKVCPKCGNEFECKENQYCWCNDPTLKSSCQRIPAQYSDCLCHSCLSAMVESGKWTMKKPTEAGLYWVWNGDWEEVQPPQLVEVEWDRAEYCYLAYSAGDDEPEELGEYEWWMGPIEVPDKPMQTSSGT